MGDSGSLGGVAMEALLGVVCITVFLFLLVGIAGAMLFGDQSSRSK